MDNARAAITNTLNLDWDDILEAYKSMLWAWGDYTKLNHLTPFEKVVFVKDYRTVFLWKVLPWMEEYPHFNLNNINNDKIAIDQSVDLKPVLAALVQHFPRSPDIKEYVARLIKDKGKIDPVTVKNYAHIVPL